MHQNRSGISQKILLSLVLSLYPVFAGMFGLGAPEAIIILIIMTLIIGVPLAIVFIVVLSTKRQSSTVYITKSDFIYCTKCGAKNDGNALRCALCGNEVQYLQQSADVVPTGTKIPNYLTQAILLTVFSALCCSLFTLPFAIVAVVFAASVKGKLNSGDLNGALDASRKARTWCWVSFWIFIGCIVLWICYIVILTIIALNS